jgi:hypothetical protein
VAKVEEPKPKSDVDTKEMAKEFLQGCWKAFLAEEEAKKQAKEAKRKAKEDRENGIVAAEEALVPVEQIPENEVLEVDSLLAVKNWAMQSADWKLLNVLFELLSVEQLQYRCDNNKTVFDVIANLLQLGLTKPYSREASEEKGMTQVKAYIMSYLVPKLINNSLSFTTADLTLTYMGLLEQAMIIEEHLKEYNTMRQSHYEVIQSMHQQLLDCKAVKFDARHIPCYERVFGSLIRTIKVKKEMHKVVGFRILKQYMTEYYN